MKKILSVILINATLATNTAYATSRYTPDYGPQIAHATRTAHRATKHAQKAQTVAVIALMTATLAVILAVKASDNNPGQIQIAQF